MSTTRKSSRPRACGLLIGVAVGLASFTPAIAQDRTAMRSVEAVPQWIEEMKLEAPETIGLSGTHSPLEKLTPELQDASGKVQVIIRLGQPAVAELDDKRGNARASHKHNVLGEQDGFLARVNAMAPGIKVLARTQLVLNAVFVEVDAALLPELAKDPAVSRIAEVQNYERALSDTVPYIGAAAVQAGGVDGGGVSVAVLDSGIDYTHADLGGPGTAAAYAAAWGVGIGDPLQTTRDGLFPTAKVVDGYDFVGELWPNFGPLLPDEDPIDLDGHGSHVADIIGGAIGVAPGVDLYAVKVCSAVSPSCSGIALIQGMEFAVDPNGDGNPDDAVDVINMSLGASYGQAFDDDLSAAVDNATALGVLTVAAAGNCGDNPYCQGTPAAAPTAISVAQTHVPSAKLFFMNIINPPIGLVNAVKYPWTPDPVGTIQGIVQYGDLDGTNLNGCAPFTGDLTGRIVAVDRGACFFSTKIRNIENAGGVLGIVMLVAPGAPFPGGFGGGPAINIPGFNISQADGDILRAGGAEVAFGPDFSVPLVGSTVSSTARGPGMSNNDIGPDIGAPGASVSAEATTGTGRTPFGGTSGASPMVAGSAALLIDQCGDDGDSDSDSDGACSPVGIKAKLMNTAYRDIISDTTGGLTEISRIGGGEVRVDAAAGTDFIAYSPDDNQPSLSLGFMDVDKPTLIKRKVTVHNLSDDKIKLGVDPTFRFADDAASGAISVSVRESVNVGDEDSKTFNVNFHVDPSKLSGNFMNSGSQGNNPAALSAMEYDGYLLLNNKRGPGEVALPWHVIPRQAARVKANRQTIVPGGFPDSIGLVNQGAGTAQNDAYTVVGLSDEQPRGDKGAQSPTPDLRAVGVNTFVVPAGFCSGSLSFVWAFAVNTWDRQSHLVPVSHQIWLDTNKDGASDYVVLNRDVSFNNVGDGRQLSWVFNLNTGDAQAFFFAEHATNTGNTIMYICGEQIGLSGPDLLATNVDAFVVAQDFYYGGPGDFIGGLTITPLGEGFFGSPSGDLAAGAGGSLNVFDFGAFPGNSPEAGVMLVTNGDRGTGARGGATQDTEALLFLAPGITPPIALSDDDDGDSD